MSEYLKNKKTERQLELAYRILNIVHDTGVDIQGIAKDEGYDTEEIKQFMKDMGIEYYE